MHSHMDKLRQTHRRLNRAIDTMCAPAREEDRKRLKKMRLMVKDRIAKLTSTQPRSNA